MIRVPAKQLPNWQLEKLFDEQWKIDVARTPALPQNPVSDEETKYIELVPYGSTSLRLTVFPALNSRDK